MLSLFAGRSARREVRDGRLILTHLLLAQRALSDVALQREKVFRELPRVLRNHETGDRLDQGSFEYWEYVRSLVGGSIDVEQQLLESILFPQHGRILPRCDVALGRSVRAWFAPRKGLLTALFDENRFTVGLCSFCVLCGLRLRVCVFVQDFQCAAQFRVNVLDSRKLSAYKRRFAAKGSFFAFLGVSTKNWFAILRDGLGSRLARRVFMKNGVASAEGVFLTLFTDVGLRFVSGPTEGAAGQEQGDAETEGGSARGGQDFVCFAVCRVPGSPFDYAFGEDPVDFTGL